MAKNHLSIEDAQAQVQREKKRKTNNKKVNEVQKQLDIVTDKFLSNPEPFYQEKEEQVAKLIERYGDLQEEDLENGVITKKDYSIQLSYYISKPIIPANNQVPAYTPNALKFANEFYWEKVVLPLNERMLYIPMLSDLLHMLNISTFTFNKYATNGSEEMREACQMIYDQFISYYQRNGLQKNIDSIMSMFVLKTTYKQRENDVPQVVNNVAVISPNEVIDKMARQYGFDTFD